jgi:hypothetical protein
VDDRRGPVGVDQHDPAAGSQYAHHLFDHRDRVVDMLQNPLAAQYVDRLVLERQCLGLTFEVLDVGSGGAVCGLGPQGGAGLDADCPGAEPGEGDDVLAGARSDVDRRLARGGRQLVEGPLLQGLHGRSCGLHVQDEGLLFDVLLGRVRNAEARAPGQQPGPVR